MKVNGVFRDWEIGRFDATHPDGYSLWIANGLMFFADNYDSLSGTSKPFLTGLGPWKRWQLWRELQRERKQRRIIAVEKLASGGTQGGQG